MDEAGVGRREDGDELIGPVAAARELGAQRPIAGGAVVFE